MTREDLWDRLVLARLARGPVPQAMPAGSPWYISAMLGIAAWIASIFLLGFVVLVFENIFRGAGGAAFVGAALCVACALAMHMRGERLFVSQFAVATSLAGQALIAFGILHNAWRSPLAWVVLALVELALVAVAPNRVHRVLSTIAAALAVRFALAHAGLGRVFPPLVAGAFVLAWLVSRRPARDASLWQPAMAGLAIAALLVVPVSLADLLAWTVRTPPLGGSLLPWLASGSLVAILLATVARILRDNGVSFGTRPALVALAAALAVGVAAQPVGGLVVALVVLLVAFGEGRRALAGLAIAGMIGALVRHYYALDATLLAKSAALLEAGIVLVVAGIALRFGVAGASERRA